MDDARPSNPAAALLAVALVWSLLLGARAPGAHGPEADAALLVAVACACAALLALRPTAPAQQACAGRGPCRGRAPAERTPSTAGPGRPTFGALLLAGATGFASFPLWLAALAAAGGALGLGPPPLVHAPGLLLAAVEIGPGPLLEELLYRERLLGALRPRLGAAGAVAVSSAVFAAAHPEPWSALGALGVGVALGALFAATRSLALAAAAHAGLNLAACVSAPA